MRALVVAAGLALAACSPQIDKGTYFCGPERLCPPDLECDEPSFTCEAPSLAEPFACPDGSEATEPDDAIDAAYDAGATRCGEPLSNAQRGCIVDDDTDLMRFEYVADCAGSDPHLEVSLRFPIAFAPLGVDLLDDAGEVVATAELCTGPSDFTGSEVLCLTTRPPAGVYYLRVQLADGPDCDGDCRFNQYYLDVTTPLS
jgi:hypothetical protein